MIKRFLNKVPVIGDFFTSSELMNTFGSVIDDISEIKNVISYMNEIMNRLSEITIYDSSQYVNLKKCLLSVQFRIQNLKVSYGQLGLTFNFSILSIKEVKMYEKINSLLSQVDDEYNVLNRIVEEIYNNQCKNFIV